MPCLRRRRERGAERTAARKSPISGALLHAGGQRDAVCPALRFRGRGRPEAGEARGDARLDSREKDSPTNRRRRQNGTPPAWRTERARPVAPAGSGCADPYPHRAVLRGADMSRSHRERPRAFRAVPPSTAGHLNPQTRADSERSRAFRVVAVRAAVHFSKRKRLETPLSMTGPSPYVSRRTSRQTFSSWGAYERTTCRVSTVTSYAPPASATASRMAASPGPKGSSSCWMS